MPGLVFTVTGCIYLMVVAAYFLCLDSGIAKDLIIAWSWRCWCANSCRKSCCKSCSWRCLLTFHKLLFPLTCFILQNILYFLWEKHIPECLHMLPIWRFLFCFPFSIWSGEMEICWLKRFTHQTLFIKLISGWPFRLSKWEVLMFISKSFLMSISS